MSSAKKKIRVLIVDDSLFIRKLLKNILAAEEDIEIVGEAVDGLSGINEAERLKPEVITMDYMMPHINGADAVEHIMTAVRPPPAVVMVSAYTPAGSHALFRSLRSGAVDYILKSSDDQVVDIDRFGRELVEKIRTAVVKHVVRHEPLPERSSRVKTQFVAHAKSVIAIGASTGGPPLLEDIISSLPADFSGAVLVAQHMPKFFTSTFAERLNETSLLRVKEAKDGEEVQAGMVFIAPGDCSMEVRNGKIFLTHYPSSAQLLLPSIDTLMRSVAAEYGRRAIGVLLSGMGRDGVDGLSVLKGAGGHVIAQELATTVVESMPASAIMTGVVDEILDPTHITRRLIELTASYGR